MIAVIGGTGDLGSGISYRLAKAGYPLVIGSRDASRAAEAAAKLAPSATGAKPRGLANREAAATADIVLLTVPFASQASTLEDIKPALAGKILVDTTVPLVPPRVARVQLPSEGCAALIAQKIVGEGTRVVSAFHNVAAHKLQTDMVVDCDVLVFGDAPADREPVVALAEACGLRGLHAGPLANSAAAEALTSILIGINRNYKVDGAGIRITGIATS